MLLVNHSVSFRCLELLFGVLMVAPRALLNRFYVKLTVFLLVRLAVVLALDLACVTRTRLSGCVVACRDFIVLVRVSPLGSSFGEALFTRYASLLMGSGEFLIHLGAPTLRIFSVLMAESAMTIVAVDTAAGTASPSIKRELRSCTDMIIIMQFGARPRLPFSEVS